MSETPTQNKQLVPGIVIRSVEAVGNAMIGQLRHGTEFVRFLGGATCLTWDALVWIFRAVFVREVRLGGENLLVQMVRVGIKSVPIVALVQVFIGIILALQMAPTLREYGQIQRVADIVGIAIFRELGPLLSGIVLSGFAGASIAAELGAMVEGEEIKALRATALNPIRFLVVPRFLATTVMLVLLTVVADVVGVLGGFMTSTFILDIDAAQYLGYTREALTQKDFITGLVKAGVFGVMISVIACYEGLNVSGGAEGVGRATTNTVVKCIVALISGDVVFTSIFYAFGL